MDSDINALTEKEKDALRLLLRGHDAKSSARELGLSVHTVNERLRDARRKLGVTSSRAAARMLLAGEGKDPERLRDMQIGDAPITARTAQREASAPRRQAGHARLAFLSVGVLAMSLTLAFLFLPASPLSMLAPTPAVSVVASAEADTAAAAQAAEAFLLMIDERRWADSYAVTGKQFRTLNTLESWARISAQVRQPLGTLLTRDLVGNEFVPAPPEGYRLIKFRSAYANGTVQTESLSLVWEEGTWRVTGIMFD